MDEDEPDLRSFTGTVRARSRAPSVLVAFALAALACIAGGAWIGDGTEARVGWAVALAIGLVLAFAVGVSVKRSVDSEIAERRRVLATWGRSHALALVDAPDLGRATPLLRDGDRQEAEVGLVGELLGHVLTCCHYTYTVEAHTDEGGTARARFTLVQIRDVAPSIGQITLHPISLADPARLWRRAARPSGRVVELESVELRRRYRLEARSDTSDAIVRRIFEPSFIDWCVDERNVLFEIEDGELVVAVRDHLVEPRALDDLLARSQWLLLWLRPRATDAPAPAEA